MPIQPDTVVRTKIRDLVRRFVRTPHLTDSIDLFGGGFLNSLFAMQLVLFVEKEFGVVVESDDLKLDNFNSIDAMVRREQEPVGLQSPGNRGRGTRVSGELTAAQVAAAAEFRAFVDRLVVPHVEQYDADERLPEAIIVATAKAGYLGAVLPERYGGAGLDDVTLGLLHEEVGRGCASLRSLLTVHSMVASAILRWGSDAQRGFWLPQLANGDVIAAFALTEPSVGSNAGAVETTAHQIAGGYALNGHKRWVSLGEVAGVYLVFARLDDKPTAFLVPRHTAGVVVSPLRGMLGTRAALLANLTLTDCEVPPESRVGAVGFGLSAVGQSALDLGRYSVASGCVGAAGACLDACLEYTRSRQQFGKPLRDHDLVKRIITDMVTGTQAARLLCRNAGRLRQIKSAAAVREVMIAKYYSATLLQRVAADAVQLHGAVGCTQQSTVARHYRDAKIMEIIEGSNEMQQLTIADLSYDLLPS
jgi:glutaryl-CoA dehydrogenase (non-decarboxylating)